MRKIRLLAAVLSASALILLGCGSDDSAPAEGEAAATNDSSAVSSEVTVTGDFGKMPTVEVPESAPSEELEVQILSEGDGPEIGADDFVIAHYLGQAWDKRRPEDMSEEVRAGLGEDAGSDPVPYVFDNSYDRNAVSGFSLNMVIPGWKEGLAGQKVGSRVLLSIPPAQGYGDQAEHDLAEDTLIFVIDVVDSVAPDAAANGEPVSDLPEGLPAVEGAESGPPSIEFGDAPEPETSDSTVVLRGDGDTLGENVLVQMIEAPYPDGEGAQSTWDLGKPEEIPTEGLAALPGWDGVADELTVGSRILTRINAEDAAAQSQEDDASPLVLIVDILATY